MNRTRARAPQGKFWVGWRESNSSSSHPQCDALPLSYSRRKIDGDGGTRTRTRLIENQVASDQFAYIPTVKFGARGKSRTFTCAVFETAASASWATRALARRMRKVGLEPTTPKVQFLRLTRLPFTPLPRELDTGGGTRTHNETVALGALNTARSTCSATPA